MPKVVSNSSPLIHLSKIDLLPILDELFDEIIVPEAVYEECVVQGGDRDDATTIEKTDWIKIKSIEKENLHLKRAFLKDVDEGESEAIVLALQESADLILLDEYDARELARNHDLNITGVIGILLEAKSLGKLENAKNHLENLSESGFWIDDELYKKVSDQLDKME
ncbi:MAG: DUF3368 domain-containing protein [Candidatus Thermoplasmatota archaeon]|nr:DUF3368 domain-containing protein [Candidatus Thermoplasmatota archaeon]